jgi:hypothetical protein
LIDPAVVDAVTAIMENTAVFFENAAPGLRDFVQGFLLLAEIGSEYLPTIGLWLSEIGASFKSWVETNPEGIRAFIEDAGAAFGSLWRIAVLVGESIFASLRGLGFGGEGGDGGLLVALEENAKKFKEWVSSDGVQGFLRLCGDIFRWCMENLPKAMEMAGTGLKILAAVFGWWRDNVWPIIRFVGEKVMEFARWVGQVAGDVGRFLADMGVRWDQFKTRIGQAVDWVKLKMNGMWDFLAPALRGAANAAIGILNGFIRGANIAISGLNLLPGVSLGQIPYVGYLAKGGIASGMAVVGERGPELVRLPAGSTVLPNNQSRRLVAEQGAAPSGQPAAIEIRFGGNTDGALASAFMRLVREGQIELAPTA